MFVLLPSIAGWGILRLLYRDLKLASFWELPAPCFALGIIAWTLLSLVGYLLEWSLMLLIGAYFALTLFALLLPRLVKTHVNLEIERNVIDLPLFVAVALLSVVYYFVGTFQDPSADSFRHLMFAQKLFEQGTLSSDVFIFSSNAPYNLLNGNYSYSGLYPLYASISSLAPDASFINSDLGFGILLHCVKDL